MANIGTSGRPAATPTGTLRDERDRFVALAFCAADILIELDALGRIAFVAGASGVLTGRSPAELTGTLFLHLVAAEDRLRVEEALKDMSAGTRVEELTLKLSGIYGDTPPLTLTGYQLADLPGRTFFALRMGPEAVSVLSRRDTESGLHNKETFAAIAGAKVSEARETGATVDLTMVKFDGMAALRGRLDDATRKDLQGRIGTQLKKHSIGGDAAGRLDEENYGFVHAPGVDVGLVLRQIQGLIKSADPTGKGLKVGQGTIAVAMTNLTGNDVNRAMIYALNRFCETQVGELSSTDFSKGLDAVAGEAADKITSFRECIRNRAFDIAFQPIVDLATREVSHFEALARFGGRDIGLAPFEVITFAEATGMIAEFDLIMCDRLLKWLKTVNARGYRYSVAANISGRSLSNPSFIAALHKLLAKHKEVRDGMMFEITESARIADLDTADKVIQGLRKAGHEVCLDDFGAGATAFHYLKALDVDVVKIDGQYIKDALHSPRSRAFLKAMAGLCIDLNVKTIAEMVETPDALPVLRECGIQFAQGYLFGKPSADVTGFSPPRPRQIKTGSQPMTGTRG